MRRVIPITAAEIARPSRAEYAWGGSNGVPTDQELNTLGGVQSTKCPNEEAPDRFGPTSNGCYPSSASRELLARFAHLLQNQLREDLGRQTRTEKTLHASIATHLGGRSRHGGGYFHQIHRTDHQEGVAIKRVDALKG